MFCYPIGKFNIDLTETVQKASFIGVRTVEMFSRAFPKNPFLFHPTLQVYNYRKWVYIRHALKVKNIKIFSFCLFQRTSSWKHLARFLFDQVVTSGGLWHLWGHSWEIDKFGLWNELEEVFKYVAHRDNISYINNSTAISIGKKITLY